jgi:hypothetical protein
MDHPEVISRAGGPLTFTGSSNGIGRMLAIVTATVLAASGYAAATAPVAYAKAETAVVSGDVTGVRGDTETRHATFTASGSPSQASGSYTFTDTGGATLTGEVTCLYRELNRAVLTGPITGSTYNEAFVLWIQDNRPDAFDAAISNTDAARQCQTNFPLNRFDELPSTDYYVVTSGDIVVGEPARVPAPSTIRGPEKTAKKPPPEVPGVEPQLDPPEIPGVEPQPVPPPCAPGEVRSADGSCVVLKPAPIPEVGNYPSPEPFPGQGPSS